MEKYCKKNKLEFRKILQEHSPRASFVTYLYSMLKILEQGIPITNYEINSSIRELHELKFKIFSENLNENNPSLRLASRIKNIPLIYYPSGLQSAAMRFKNSLQENAKMHTIVEDIIETSHNGIVAWEKKSNVFPILLQGKDDHIKTKERWKILKEYFLKNQIDFEEVTSIKGDILSKITSLIYLLDYTSIYKSILTKTDPSPVKSIEFIKNRLR